MHIVRGPRASRGVTTLMHVGNYEVLDGNGFGREQIHTSAKIVGYAATAVWIFGWLTKHEKAKKYGMGVAIAALVTELTTK